MSRPREPVHDCRHRYRDNLYIVQVGIVYKSYAPLILDMVLDTGASYVCIPDDVYDALAIVTLRTVPMATASSVYNARIGVVERITLDEVVVVPSVEVATTPRKMDPYSGLLGGSFLREVGVFIDPRKRLLRFHHKGAIA